ncbi:hypothetical protein CBL_20888 [Carabus blaptoides fortunei]
MESSIESISTRIRILQHQEFLTEDESEELIDLLDRKTQMQDKHISDLQAAMACYQDQLNKLTAALTSLEKKNKNKSKLTMPSKKKGLTKSEVKSTSRSTVSRPPSPSQHKPQLVQSQ